MTGAPRRGHLPSIRLGVVVPRAVVALLLAVAACRPPVPPDHPGHRRAAGAERPREAATERGIASWYGPGFHGRRTASGERFDMHEISAAHRTLPFGTVVRVRNLDNGRTLKVRINDRGPFVDGRILDLSRGAARRLGMVEAGVADIELEVLRWPDGYEAVPRRRSVVVPAATASLVQIGAFREPERARHLADRARVLAPGVGVFREGDWHRVQIRELDRQRAQRLAAELRAAGFEALVLEVAKGVRSADR